MTNPFSLSHLEALSQSALTRSMAEYKRILSQLGQFSDNSQIQDIRALVHHALDEIEVEANGRMRLVPVWCARITRSEATTEQYPGFNRIGMQKRDTR